MIATKVVSSLREARIFIEGFIDDMDFNNFRIMHYCDAEDKSSAEKTDFLKCFLYTRKNYDSATHFISLNREFNISREYNKKGALAAIRYKVQNYKQGSYKGADIHIYYVADDEWTYWYKKKVDLLFPLRLLQGLTIVYEVPCTSESTAMIHRLQISEDLLPAWLNPNPNISDEHIIRSIPRQFIERFLNKIRAESFTHFRDITGCMGSNKNYSELECFFKAREYSETASTIINMMIEKEKYYFLISKPEKGITAYMFYNKKEIVEIYIFASIVKKTREGINLAEGLTFMINNYPYPDDKYIFYSEIDVTSLLNPFATDGEIKKEFGKGNGCEIGEVPCFIGYSDFMWQQ